MLVSGSESKLSRKSQAHSLGINVTGTRGVWHEGFILSLG